MESFLNHTFFCARQKESIETGAKRCVETQLAEHLYNLHETFFFQKRQPERGRKLSARVRSRRLEALSELGYIITEDGMGRTLRLAQHIFAGRQNQSL